MIALITVSIIRSLFRKKKNLPIELFVAGLQYENNGHFDKLLLIMKKHWLKLKGTGFTTP
jgi:hypothetical protein